MPVTMERKPRRKLSPEERREQRLNHWARTVGEILILRKQGSARYNEAEEKLNKLLAKKPKLRVGRLIPYKEGNQVRIKDVFEEAAEKGNGHKVFRAHGINRYELEVSDANGKVIRNPD